MLRKIPQLDAVRGLAILVVMLHNLDAFAGTPFAIVSRYGWIGVDLFFVLSGFLITGILLDSKDSQSYFRSFYTRRIFRIWPLYYSLLFALFVLLPLLRPVEAHTLFARSAPWWSYVLFLQNFLMATPTLAAGPLGVTWSLAIEEQFYLVWPLVLRYCSLSRLRQVTIAIILLSAPLRLYLSLRGVGIYSNLFCRLDGLMAGAFLAILVRSRKFEPARFCVAAWAMIALAIPGVVASERLDARWFTFSLTALASAAFLFLSMYSPNRWLQTILKSRFLIFTGTISYGLYLLHKIPLDLLKLSHQDHHPFLAVFLVLLFSYLLAYISWNLLERPFLRLRQWLDGSHPGPMIQNPSPAGPSSASELT